MTSVSGKIALVTGGGSGIGLSFCELIVSKGAKVIIGDLRLQPEAQKLVESSNGNVVFKQTDVTDWKQLTDLFTYAEKEVGAPDLVVLAAGIFEPKWSSFWEDTETSSYKTVDINITHPIKATRLAIRSFLRNSKSAGTILHLSSIGGQTTRLGVPIYCATKAFINHFVRAFASLESSFNIRVLAVAPGMVRTPLWFEQNPEKLKSVTEADHWIEPREIAEALLECFETREFPGGSIVEASGQGRRRGVEVFNDAGPPGIGGTEGSNTALEEDVMKMMEQERGRK
ncbi:NAD(P)-binding protein [Aulographum hederae CBS 113979]|uniref:NAD(P)-binding protein n=1 Tax=Aulographum hederae CBS 113979 TaxID=1176131 RepID=A0A6G1HBA5_9PEZI|nr:NAD(P)-binding protein [Aulographum hederae CBS 113979]